MYVSPPPRLPALLVLAASVFGSDPDYARAKRKIESIAEERLRPGATVSLTVSEINAYVRAEAASAIPQGFRNIVIFLPAAGRATGEGIVDFSKLGSPQSARSWLWRWLLEGERPVSVAVSVESGGGSAVVRIERVEISGVPVEGRALEFLLDTFVRPRYPDAKIGEPFALRHNMEAVLVEPERVVVKIKGQRREAMRPATSRPIRTQSGTPIP